MTNLSGNMNIPLLCLCLWLGIFLHPPSVSGFAPNTVTSSLQLTSLPSLPASSASSSSSSALHGFKFPNLFSWDKPTKSTTKEPKIIGERNGLDPEYPWRFEGRFIFRPSLVRTSSGSSGPPSANLISLFGYSLGGSVVLEYDVSPVGPYREYVTMGGVVAGGLVNVGENNNRKFLGIGQWGENLYVTTQVAEDVCKQVWGVPAQVAEIAFVEEGDTLSDMQLGGDKKFSLSGWKNARVLSTSSETNVINGSGGSSCKRYGNIPIFWTPTIKALWAPIAFPSFHAPKDNDNNEGDEALPVHKLRLSGSALRVKRCDRKLDKDSKQSNEEIPLGLALIVDNVLIEIGERVTSGSL